MKEIKYLNGIRSIAIISVILYHFNFTFFKGGFLGVDIFFVMSGFLTCSKLILEYENDNLFLKDFYKKRFLRIFPSLIFMISFVLLFILLFENYIFSYEKTNAVFSILGLNNYFQVFQNIDYFEKSIYPMPFIHMWSLAIEIQFYILFPIFLKKLLKSKTKKDVSKILFVIALISSISLFVQFNYLNPTLAYYGTFSRLTSLLLGAIVALNFKEYKSLVKNRFSKNTIKLITYILLILIFDFLIIVEGSSKFIYNFGFLYFGVITSLLIVFLASEETFIKKIFSKEIFKYIATRSYNYYLWHIPIIILLPDQNIVVKLILIIIISEFVYKNVETKIYKEDFSFLKRNREVFIFLGLLIYLIPSVFLTMENKEYIKEINSSENIYSLISGYKDVLLNPNKILNNSKKKLENYKKGEEKISKQKIFLFGDSIIEDVKYIVEDNYKNAKVLSKVGIQSKGMINMMEKYRKYDSEKTIIIFDAGNNGIIKIGELEEIKKMFLKSKIIVINSAVDKPWARVANKNIDNYLKENPGSMTLIRWNEVKNKKELITGDEVHLTTKGIKKYSGLIEKAIYEVLNIKYIK